MHIAEHEYRIDLSPKKKREALTGSDNMIFMLVEEIVVR